MMNHAYIMFSVMYIGYCQSASLKVNINPPEHLLLNITLNYLKISDTLLTTHETSNVSLDEYAKLLNSHSVFTSLFQWKMNTTSMDQFRSFTRVLSSSGKHRKVVFFLDYESTQAFIEQAHSIRYKLHLPCFYRWVFFDFEGVDMTELQYPSRSAVCWRTLFVTRRDDRESEDIRLTLVSSTFQAEGGCVINETVGQWSSSTGLTQTTVFRKRIMNYKNYQFPASFYTEPPFYGKSQDKTRYEGMEYELVQILKERLNFRIKFIPNTDHKFGYQHPNGTWVGFVGLIANGKALFSIATLSITNRRMKAVDFSSPYIFGKLSFVVLSPALESRKFVLIKPLQKEVWEGIGVTLVICTSVLYLITHSLPCKSGVRNSYNIWFLLRTLGQQGTPSPAPARYSIRFFISGWWFFIMVILWSYAGTLTSFMTYPGRRPAIDRINKLIRALKSRSIRYGTLGGTSYEHFLKIDMSEVDPIFGESMEEYPEGLVPNETAGMELVLKGRYAFVYLKAVLKWEAATMGYDQFRFSEDVFSTEAIGVACQKCHPLKKSFDHIVDRLEETGLFSKWYDDGFVKASIRAPHVEIPGVRALSFDDVQGAFYFLGISLFIATIVVFLEVIVARIVECCILRTKKKRKGKKPVNRHKIPQRNFRGKLYKHRRGCPMLSVQMAKNYHKNALNKFLYY